MTSENYNISNIELNGLDALPPRLYFSKRLQMERGCLTALCAKGNAGKSIFGQYLVTCYASGLPLFGCFPFATTGAVLHIDQEQNKIQTERRYQRLANALGITKLPITRLYVKERLGTLTQQLDEFENYITDLCGERKINMIMIDSLKKLTSAEENSQDIETPTNRLKLIADKTDGTVMVIIHKGKGSTEGVTQTGRGHSTIFDTMDTQMDLDKDDEREVFTLSQAKSREDKKFDSIEYKMNYVGDWHEAQNCSYGLEFAMVREFNHAQVVIDTIVEYLQTNEECPKMDLIKGVGGSKERFMSAYNKLLKTNTISERVLGKSKLISLVKGAI